MALRQALEQYGNTHWQGFSPALLRRSAFASETTVLREADPLPADARMAVLPPVSKGRKGRILTKNGATDRSWPKLWHPL